MSTREGGGLAARSRQLLASRFVIDRRSLAALRIALALLLLADLLRRGRFLVALYTDAGAFPRETLQSYSPLFYRLSLHTLSGDLLFQLFLFAVAGLFALCLVIGYRTKLATAASLILLISLQARNPVILNSGDALLRRLLFWSLFLPLGSCWSVDARQRDADSRWQQADAGIFGPATVGLLLQVLAVYVMNAILKIRGGAWPGDVVQTVLSLDRFSTPFGELLAQFPALIGVFDYLWLALLVCSPLLILSTGYPRLVLVSLFASMHLGMALSMHLGVFPLVSVASLLPFVPALVWNRIPSHSSGILDTLSEVLPTVSTISVRSRLRTTPRALAGGLIVVLLILNGIGLGYLDAPDATPEQVSDPTWSMFAENPPDERSWFVMPATLESGRQIDALQRANVTWERPDNIYNTFPDERWRKLIYKLPLQEESALREPFAQYLCSRWNSNQNDRMEQVQIVNVREPVSFDGSTPSQQRNEIGQYSC